MPEISITTDYVTSKGCPEPYLRAISEAGFSHIHWCHQWNTDFLYSDSEIEQILRWLNAYGLQLLDLHASQGQEKSWVSAREYERLAGVELVRNRLEMTARLGGDAIVMHVEPEPDDTADRNSFWSALLKSLDELETVSRKLGVRIAVENLARDNYPTMRNLFSRYGPDFLSLCYDPGHGNITGNGLAQLETVKDRLIVLHLNDNDGKSDLHKLLFSDTVDWRTLAGIIASSSYRKCMSMEVAIRNTGIEDEAEFLRQAYESGTRFDAMVHAVRS